MSDFTITILGTSILLQLAAAVGALRLVQKTEKAGYAWLLIAAAMMLMAARRIVTFIGFFLPQVEATVKGPIAESIALAIALLMLFGVLRIPTIFESLRAAGEQAETLQVASQALSTTLELPQVLELILTQLNRVVPYDSASVQQLQDRQLSIIGCRGFPNPDEIMGMRFDLETGSSPNQEVIRTLAPVILADAPSIYGEFHSDPHAPAGIRSWLGVPLLFGAQVIGMLALDKREADFFSSEHARLALAFAANAAIAIENARLFSQANRRADELAVLMRLSQAISAKLDLDFILDTTYQSVGELMSNDAFWISTYESGASHSQYLKKIDRGVHYPLDQFSINADIGGYTLRTGLPVLMDNPARLPVTARYGEAEPVATALCVPLLIGDQVIGAMSTQSYMPEAYSDKELELLQKLAQPVAIALENARLFKAEQDRARDMAVLNDITRTAVQTTDFQTMAQVMTERLSDLLAADGCYLMLWDQERHRALSAAGYGPQLPHSPDHDGDEAVDALADAILSGQETLVIENIGASPFHKTPLATLFPDGTLLGLPLITSDHQLGAVLVAFAQAHSISPDEIARGEQAAGQIALALARARLFEQVQHHAIDLEQRVWERTQELARANEQLKELDRLKSNFVSDVSHELRTPVTNLRMYLDLLERGRPERKTQYISILKVQAGRLQQLIADILDLSRLEMARATTVEFRPIDLNELIDQVIAVHQPRADEAGLRLTFTPTQPLPAIPGERNQLIQVVTNLVTNALNYTPAGHIHVKTCVDNQQQRVCLSVEDSGMGIETDDLPHIFDRFYRGKAVSQQAIAGTGLGLGIVKEIVDLHQGKIDVDSVVGGGTTFHVWLPLEH